MREERPTEHIQITPEKKLKDELSTVKAKIDRVAKDLKNLEGIRRRLTAYKINLHDRQEELNTELQRREKLNETNNQKGEQL